MALDLRQNPLAQHFLAESLDDGDLLAVEVEEGLHAGIVQVEAVDVERGHHLALLGIGDGGLDGLAGHAKRVLRHDTTQAGAARDEFVEEIAVGIEGIDALAGGLQHREDIQEGTAVEEHEVVELSEC